MEGAISNCRGCGAEVRWVKSAKSGKPMICDPTLVTADGTNERQVLITPDGRYIRNPEKGTTGYVDHHATCPNADDFRSHEVGKDKHCNNCGFDYKATKCPRCN